jgi:hypothetical protein
MDHVGPLESRQAHQSPTEPPAPLLGEAQRLRVAADRATPPTDASHSCAFSCRVDGHTLTPERRDQHLGDRSGTVSYPAGTGSNE